MVTTPAPTMNLSAQHVSGVFPHVNLFHLGPVHLVNGDVLFGFMLRLALLFEYPPVPKPLKHPVFGFHVLGGLTVAEGGHSLLIDGPNVGTAEVV